MIVNQQSRAQRLQALHAGGTFVIANAWDGGSARILASLGFPALATSSGAAAGVLGRLDHGINLDESLANAKLICDSTDLPVSADLEKGFGDAPADAARAITRAAEVGLVGGSIEDATGRQEAPIFDIGLATERVAAAAEAARALPFPFTLMGRAENFLNGRNDLDDTIRRLQAYRTRRRGRVVCAGTSGPGRRAHGVRVAHQTRELHGGHPRQVLFGGRARGSRRAAHQPGDLAVSRGHDRPHRGGARNP